MNPSLMPLLSSDYFDRFFPKDNDGYDKVVLGHYFGFFFANGYEKEKRARAMQVAEDYWQLCGQHLKWMTHPRTFNWRKIPKEFTMQQWLTSYPIENWVWQMAFHGGHIPTEVSNYQIIGNGNSRETFSTSHLYLFVPIDWFTLYAQHPITLYIRWAVMLQAEHGTSGIGLIRVNNEVIAGETDKLAREFAHLFPGIELCDPTYQSIMVLKGLLSINWLNQIDTHYIDQLGGIEQIRHTLQGTQAQIHHYQGGIVISTGKAPELCEQGQFTVPPASYTPVARLLKPLRTTYESSFWGCQKEHSLAWLARFDGE